MRPYAIIRGMRRWFSTLLAMLMAAALGVSAPLLPTAAAADIPIGGIGETLRVQDGNLIADVTVVNIVPSEVPPGFGYPPRPPRHQVWKAQILTTVGYGLSRPIADNSTEEGRAKNRRVELVRK